MEEKKRRKKTRHMIRVFKNPKHNWISFDEISPFFVR